MPRRKEIPLSPIGIAHGTHKEDQAIEDSPLEWRGSRAARRVAATEMQALMEAAPHEEPRSSTEGLLPLRDVIQDAIERVLTPREHWIFDACVVERKSIREVGRELNLAKSWVDRLAHRAKNKLREALAQEPIIVDYLERNAVERDAIDVEQWGPEGLEAEPAVVGACRRAA